MDASRPLTSRERELVALLLPAESFPDVQIYRAQLSGVTVTGRCDCGCATVYLDVDPTAPRAEPGGPGDSPLPYEARGNDPVDPSRPVEIILFAREGALASLEIVFYGDTPPTEFPDPPSLEVLRLR